jgi:hypothetical protein
MNDELTDTTVYWKGKRDVDMTKDELVKALRELGAAFRAAQARPVDYRAMVRERMK